MISPKTYFLSEDRQVVVEEGDARAKFLVVRAGQEINDALAEQYGITGEKVSKAGPVTTPFPAPVKKKRGKK